MQTVCRWKFDHIIATCCIAGYGMVNEASVTVFLRRCVAVENVNIPVPTLAGVLAQGTVCGTTAHV
jgi:hypothetical protein